jgi:hypothetical protein
VSAYPAVKLRPQAIDHPAPRHRRPRRLDLRHAPLLAVVFVGLGAVLHFMPGRPVVTVDGFFHLSNTYNCGQDTLSWTFF